MYCCNGGDKSMKGLKKARAITVCAAFTALITVCAWISVPTTPPFTMQSFAVLLTGALLPIRHALAAYSAYLLLGAVGLPVFSTFTGGIGIFLGPTGGYLLGFFAVLVVTRFVVSRFGHTTRSLIAAFLAGSVLLYVLAAVYYSAVYLGRFDLASVTAAFGVCVLPFVVFDLIKLAAAVAVARRLERMIVL